MSNVDVIMQFYAHFKARDRQAYLALCDEKIEWVAMEGMPAGGSYIGKDAVFGGYFPSMLSSFEEFHAVAEEFLGTENDTVLVIGRYLGKVKGTRAEFEAPFAHVYTIKSGKIAKFRQYTDTAMIRQALTSRRGY
jgi:uncharacterized protein